jgi:UDP-glucuronate 4-epimerase
VGDRYGSELAMRCLITGTAGFIGFHLARRLLQQGHEVIGVDGMTSYYDIKLKVDRHAQLEQFAGFRARSCMLQDFDGLRIATERSAPDIVIHLAAQAGVRHSLENPRAYLDSNIIGTFNVLELCRQLRPRHLLITSSSSVYGAHSDSALTETDRSDLPLSVYAASKKSAETIAHCYAHLWNIPITICRLFSVYGPWGRPDMALSMFLQNILAGRPINVYNHGQMERDFTYVDDVVEAIDRLCGLIPERCSGPSSMEKNSSSFAAPYRIVNIGGGRPVSLLHLIEELERAVGQSADRHYMEMQAGDVTHTDASTEYLEALIGHRPRTPISVGVPEFVRWYREYYRV